MRVPAAAIQKILVAESAALGFAGGAGGVQQGALGIGIRRYTGRRHRRRRKIAYPYAILLQRYGRERHTGITGRGHEVRAAPGKADGQTHLAVAALRRIIAKGFQGVFFDYQNLLDRIRSGFDPNSGSSDREAYRDALEAEVLLLDDLGAHRVLPWIEDVVTSIITQRCNNRLALIATTNLPEPETGDRTSQKLPDGTIDYRRTLTDQIGVRARSRLFEMCRVAHMPLVRDYRLRKSTAF